MVGERSLAPHKGVYIPIELRLLRSVVQEVLRTAATDIDKEDAETIAREVMAAYREGVMDREDLVQVARNAAKRCAADRFYERASGFFA